MSTSSGNSNAFRWVRVLMTTFSPSFRSLLEMATPESCH